MKYMSEFRDGDLARHLAAQITDEAQKGARYQFMEFCGGHTHAIHRYGICDLLPDNVALVHGPGCPVCVMPGNRIDEAIALVRQHGVILCTYGDMFKVPGATGDSFFTAKAGGGDIRMVYSTMDALEIARKEPLREVVFFAIGFETTSPPTAIALITAAGEGVKNFSVFAHHLLTPPAIAHILESPEVRDIGTVRIDGFVGPAHVSSVIGLVPYEYFADEFHKPVVVTGFEPADVLQGILLLVRQVNTGQARVENQYIRVVTREGNVKAQQLVAEVFELKTQVAWRGLGLIPYSGLKIKAAYAAYDAEVKFDLKPLPFCEPKGCRCGAILRGAQTPWECPLFGTGCTPDHPIGPCMVSSEGACSAYFNYKGTKRPPHLKPREP